MIEQWLTLFLDDPYKSISNLFSGRARLGKYMRLDIPELLYIIFTSPNVEPHHVRLLDEALLHWLTSMRVDYAAQVKSLGFSIFTKRICEALTAMSLLALSSCRDEIRKDLITWLRYFTPLRLGSDRDPALECWRLLSSGQDYNTNPTMWLKLANDPRPEYLRVSLLGLANIPYSQDTRQNQIWIVQAILTYAVIRFGDPNSAKSWFNREIAALRGRYPRSPQYWETIISTAISGFRPSAANSALHINQFINLLEPASHDLNSDQPMSSPAPRSSFNELLSAILDDTSDTTRLVDKLFVICEQNYTYAIRTGDTDFFVKTLDNLGRKILRRGNLDADQMRIFGLLIEQAIEFQPANNFCWGLMAEWYYHQEQYDQCEWVLRERVRLFPGNTICQNELALHLIDQGDDNYDEAQLLLSKCIKANPADTFSFMSLVSLLFKRGSSGDMEFAEQLLRMRLRTTSNDKFVVLRLAKLLGRSNDKERLIESLNLLRSYISVHPSDEEVIVTLAKMLIQCDTVDHLGDAESLLFEDLERNPSHELTRIALIKLLFSKGELKFHQAEAILSEVTLRRSAKADSFIQETCRYLYEIDRSEKAAEIMSKYYGVQTRHTHIQEQLGNTTDMPNQLTDSDWFDDSHMRSAMASQIYGRSMTSGVATRSIALERRNREPGIGNDLYSGLLGLLPKSNAERRNIAINELARRADIVKLSKKLLQVNIDSKVSPYRELIDIATSGDQLAGLFLQYIDPATTVEPPPSAWAWKAWKAWQSATEEQGWMVMIRGFPEARIELSALMHLRQFTSNATEDVKPNFPYALKNKPVGQLIKGLYDNDTFDRLPESIRNEYAFDILQSAALSPVVF
jgi:tetratricopeptide (TPR) repeat protein